MHAFKLDTVYLFLLALIFLSGCTKPQTHGYREMYAHLADPVSCGTPFKESDYFLIILTNARHLDYSNNHSFFQTVAKHPDDASKQGDVGHAWIYLQGIKDGEPIYLEGGYSGESGQIQARYFDGIMNYMDYGSANPSPEEMSHPVEEPNPAKYLWEIQYDGFFQWGSGCHRPTYAAKIDLSPEQFDAICSFINTFPYREYSIIHSQCASFASEIAALAGWKLECKITIPIEPRLRIGKRDLLFWTDPRYSLLTVSSPDVLEKSLMQSVREGRAEYALEWYQKTHPESWNARTERWRKNIVRFPKRLVRYLMIAS